MEHLSPKTASEESPSLRRILDDTEKLVKEFREALAAIVSTVEGPIPESPSPDSPEDESLLGDQARINAILLECMQLTSRIGGALGVPNCARPA